MGKPPRTALGTVSGGDVALHTHTALGAANPAWRGGGRAGVSASAAKLLCDLGGLNCSPQITPK